MFDLYPISGIGNGWGNLFAGERIFRPPRGLRSAEGHAFEQSVAMSAVAGRTPIHVGGLPDEDLVRLARAGHEAAFDAIVHRYRSPLQAYCRRWLDVHRAEEVVQHTLMKAFVCVRDDARPLVLRPWLYRVAHNAALNAVEKKGSDWEQLDENYDGVPQPPQVAEQRARFLRVVGEIGALPARQREALLLNEFEGRCYADIATELGTSESGVRGLLRRARRQLRETAAALLLPFPIVRELVRSNGGRGLEMERSGELIGTASAAGGVGAAGGFAKVAAGVLAAGTIAGGGSAIEHRDDPLRVSNPKADVAAVQEAHTDGVTQTLVDASTSPVPPYAVSAFGMSGDHFVAGAGLTPGREGAHSGVEAMETEEPAADDPTSADGDSLLPLDSLVPTDGGTEEDPAQEEPAAGEVQGGDPQSGEPSDPASEQPPAEEQPPPDDQTDSSNPDAVAATPDLP
jgi:RNA polymerase sigma factor (sigma-70 family)